MWQPTEEDKQKMIDAFQGATRAELVRSLNYLKDICGFNPFGDGDDEYLEDGEPDEIDNVVSYLVNYLEEQIEKLEEDADDMWEYSAKQGEDE